MPDLPSVAPLNAGPRTAHWLVRTGRTFAIVATYLWLAWCLSLALRAKSVWVILLLCVLVAAIAVHLSDRLPLTLAPRPQKFVDVVGRWKGWIFSSIFVCLWAVYLGPATTHRYWIHPTKCLITEQGGASVAYFAYIDHPRFQANSSGEPRRIGLSSGGEGIAIYTQPFIQAHPELEGATVPVVLKQQLRFGWPDPKEWQLFAIGPYLGSEHQFAWGDNTTRESLKEWSPVPLAAGVTKTQVEETLGIRLP